MKLNLRMLNISDSVTQKKRYQADEFGRTEQDANRKMAEFFSSNEGNSRESILIRVTKSDLKEAFPNIDPGHERTPMTNAHGQEPQEQS